MEAHLALFELRCHLPMGSALSIGRRPLRKKTKDRRLLSTTELRQEQSQGESHYAGTEARQDPRLEIREDDLSARHRKAQDQNRPQTSTDRLESAVEMGNTETGQYARHAQQECRPQA